MVAFLFFSLKLISNVIHSFKNITSSKWNNNAPMKQQMRRDVFPVNENQENIVSS